MKKIIYTFLFHFMSLVIFFGDVSDAKTIQILHTNDLHGYFDHYEHFPERGGYAAVKTVIDQYRQWGENAGIETIYVDAGDFSEGQIFYNANDGERAFKMLDHLGVDIGVLGNHDYLMGTDSLDQVLGTVQLKVPLLGTNVHIEEEYTHIKKSVIPFVTKNFDDIKVAFMGVTTDSALYTWRINNGEVSDPIKTGKKWAKRLAKDHDFVIAINHIGVGMDKKFAKKSKKYVDLVIGAHSHTTLHQPIWIKGKGKKKIAVVQAGKHGKYVGRILLDLNKGEPLKLLKYQLLPIKNIYKDEYIQTLVATANNDLFHQYGEDWLKTIVGYSDLPISRGPDDDDDDKTYPAGTAKSIYQNFIVDALKESVDADVAINPAPMAGHHFPIGAVTRRDIMNSYPRVFDFKDPLGWHVYTAKVQGSWLKNLLKWVMVLGFEHKLYLSGIDFQYRWRGKKRALIKNLTINGAPIDEDKMYTVALPEGIVRGGFAISKLTGLLLKKSQRTMIPIWQALEDKFLRDGRVGLDYLNNFALKQLSRGKISEHMVVTPPSDEH